MQSPAFFAPKSTRPHEARHFAAPPSGRCGHFTARFPEIHSLPGNTFASRPPFSESTFSLQSPNPRRAASGKPGRRSPGIPPPAGRAAGDGSFSPKQRSGSPKRDCRFVSPYLQDAQPRHFQSRISGRSTPYSRIYWSCSTSLSFISCTRWALRPPRSGR